METLIFGLKAAHTMYLLALALISLGIAVGRLTSKVNNHTEQHTTVKEELKTIKVETAKTWTSTNQVGGEVSRLDRLVTSHDQEIKKLVESEIRNTQIMNNFEKTQAKQDEMLEFLNKNLIIQQEEAKATKALLANTSAKMDRLVEEFKSFKEAMIEVVAKLKA